MKGTQGIPMSWFRSLLLAGIGLLLAAGSAQAQICSPNPNANPVDPSTSVIFFTSNCPLSANGLNLAFAARLHEKLILDFVGPLTLSSLNPQYFPTYSQLAMAVFDLEEGTTFSALSDTVGSFRDTLYVQHTDQDVTSYTQDHTNYGIRVKGEGPFLSGAWKPSHKNIIGLNAYCLAANSSTPLADGSIPGCGAILGDAFQYGAGIGDNEFAAHNPSAAAGSIAQSVSLAAVQAIIDASFADADSTHTAYGLLLTNSGTKAITSVIGYSGQTGKQPTFLDMSNATVTTQAIIMPASSSLYNGTIINYGLNNGNPAGGSLTKWRGDLVGGQYQWFDSGVRVGFLDTTGFNVPAGECFAVNGVCLVSAGGATSANPTATAGPTAVNGIASTFMTSDSAPAVQVMNATTAGLAPTPPNDATKFLSGAATYVKPPGSGSCGTTNTIAKFNGTVTTCSGAIDNGSTIAVATEAVNLLGVPTLSHLLTTTDVHTVLSTLNVQALSSTGTDNFLGSFGLDASTAGNNVALFESVIGRNGSGNIWAENPVADAVVGFFGAANVMHTVEVDINNHDTAHGDVLAIPTDCVPTTTPCLHPSALLGPYSVGLSVSGGQANASTVFYNTVALSLGGGSFQFSLAAFGDVAQAVFYEHATAAIYGLDLSGPHTIGVNVAQAAVPFDGTVVTDQRFVLRGKQNLSTGVTITSSTSAGGAYEGLELQGTEVRVTNGPLSSGFPTGAAATQGDVNIHGNYKIDGATITCSNLAGGCAAGAGNLTGPITSVGLATSIASQTGTGTTFAVSVGPTFTGVPAAPTAAPGTNTTQLATTAFVTAATPAATTSTAGLAKLHNVPVAIGWVAANNPNNATIAVINQASTISAIIGDVEVATGGTATVSVNKAPSGTACSAGTTLHSGSFNANGTAATNQTLTVTTSSLAVGDRLCLQTTGTTTWTGGTGIGGITVFLAPS